MDYASKGSLFAYVVEQRHLSEGMARWILQQMMLALDYCHRKVGSRVCPHRSWAEACMLASAPRWWPWPTPPSPRPRPSLTSFPQPSTPHWPAPPQNLFPHLPPPQGISNRDIKLENTLLHWPDHLPMPLVKICDFG
jgi:serine/threonine protein kinase